jgi:WD40 repeat protein
MMTQFSAQVTACHFWKLVQGASLESGIFMQDFYPRISAVGPVSAHVAVPNTDKKEMKIWEATKREVIHWIPLGDKRPYALAFSPDGKQLAVGEDAYTASLWELSTGSEVHRFVNHKKSTLRRLSKHTIGRDGEMVRALAFSPDGMQLACGGKLDAIRI